jgi:hypothetical protein
VQRVVYKATRSSIQPDKLMGACQPSVKVSRNEKEEALLSREGMMVLTES